MADVIVGGVLPPPGDTIWEQSRWIARDQTLRNFALNEPRGGVFRHMNLLVPPKDPRADAAFIIMEPEDTPPMSGSNSICVATVLLDGGLFPMQEPETHLVLEAPGVLVHVRAECQNGKAEMAGKIGSLEPRKQADLIRISLDDPRLHPVYDIYSMLTYANLPSDVRATMVAGQLLMQDRCVNTIDPVKTMADALRIARKFKARILEIDRPP